MASSTTIEREQLIAALRLRYDHYSAEAVLETALARAGLSAAAAAYDAAQLGALRAALARVGDRLGAVDARLDELLASAPTVAVAPAAPQPVPQPVPVPLPLPVPVPVPVPAPLPVPVPAATMTIALTREPVDDGAEVLVCGGSPALGEWDPSRALPMARAGDRWVASLVVAPGTELAFKFLERRPDGEVVWEGGDNHVFAAAPRIEAVWR